MTDDLSKALASTVRAAREERGLTLAALADISGVSRAMISRSSTVTHSPPRPCSPGCPARSVSPCRS
ncbi:helix-turn-helix domain-containing protein [Catellatospora bangladeshensis]|uniref:helix-turn-helix domain-containing protein n=1 Tax=Catellatospora bangladeshensis TaxID=310355 RepID=UPI003616ACBE